MRNIENKSVYQQIYDNNKDRLTNVAINYFNKKITYKTMFSRIDIIASYLVNNGVKPGNVVSVCLPNTPEAIYLFYAINKIGAIANMVDCRFKAERLAEAVNSVDSKMLFIFDELVPEFDKAIDDTELDKIVSVSAIESLPSLIKKFIILQNKSIKNDKTVIKHKDKIDSYQEILYTRKVKTEIVYNSDVPAAYEHTSGTTGKSKVVSLSNKTFLSVVHGYENFGPEVPRSKPFLSIIPPFLSYGIVASIHLPLAWNMEVVLIPKFDTKGFYNQLLRYKPAMANAANSHWGYVKKSIEDKENEIDYLQLKINSANNDLINGNLPYGEVLKCRKKINMLKKELNKKKEKLARINFDFLTVAGIGGDSINPQFEKELNEVLKKYGSRVEVSIGYGMTEMGSTFAAYRGYGGHDEGSTGIPFVSNSAMVYEDNEEKGYNNIGNLYVSGPSMMTEYVNNEDLTNQTIVEIDGKKWINTGDIGQVNTNGEITILGRNKRLIITDGGNKIIPFVVESVISKHPAVENVCVVEAPDAVRGKICKAHIIIKKQYEALGEDVIPQIEKLCKENLQDNYLPSAYQIDREFPKTSSDKIDINSIQKLDEELFEN